MEMVKMNSFFLSCILFSLFFLYSCSFDDSYNESSFESVVVDEYNEESSNDLLIKWKNARRIDANTYVSFLSPNSKNTIDTITFPLGENSCYSASCFLGDDSFYCAKIGDDEYNPLVTDFALDYDTLFLNYRERKKMDYLPYQKIPQINFSILRRVLEKISTDNIGALTDTIVSAYKLKAKNIVQGVDFVYRIPLEKAETNQTVNSCAAVAEYPQPVKRFRYQLFRDEKKVLPRDTIIKWTLIYTDQYGRSDSLDIKTKFY